MRKIIPLTRDMRPVIDKMAADQGIEINYMKIAENKGLTLVVAAGIVAAGMVIIPWVSRTHGSGDFSIPEIELQNKIQQWQQQSAVATPQPAPYVPPQPAAQSHSSTTAVKEFQQQPFGSLSPTQHTASAQAESQPAVAAPSSHTAKAQTVLSLDDLIKKAKDVHEKYKGGKTDSEKAKASAASTAWGLLESMKNSGGTPSFSDMQRYAEATAAGNLALCSTHTSRLFKSGKTNTQILIEEVDKYLKQTQETTFDSIQNFRNNSPSSSHSPPT